jgi:hypothetical protein
MADATKARATQEFVPIREVRDGIIVLKDGSLRSILMTSTLNFALKSEDEQTAILLQFQAFLNSLDFSVQFLIQSRDLDIRPYLALLEERYKEQINDLMKIQTREYIEFIKSFTESTEIMAKTFYVVIPYEQSVVQSQGGVGGFLNRSESKDKTKAQVVQFEEARTQLEQRMAVVEQGLSRCGVKVVQLGSEEVIELFYKVFNPGDLDKPVTLNQQQVVNS